MTRFTVIIAGAGLGGLALAQGLRRAGIDYTVYERDAALDSRRQGYRLHLDSAAEHALQQTLPPELADRFHATSGTPRPRFTLLDRELRELFTQESDDIAYAVDRLTLRRILLAGLEDSVTFGTGIDGYEIDRDGRIVVHLDDGSTASADVLVGADGINSAVRQQYLPYAQVVETGVWQIYGAVPLDTETRKLFDDNMFGIFTAVAGFDGTFAGVAPVEFPANTGLRDYMTCSFGARSEWFEQRVASVRDLDGTQLHDLITAAVRTWHPRLREIVAHCDPVSLFALPLRTSVPIPSWPTTRVTLLGDAIHAMSPASGAGACTALRDAAHLSDALVQAAQGRDVHDALHEYECNMIDYGFAAVRGGAENGQRFLGQDPLPAGV
ncbi:FAD-dependent oxidoreductase [Nocardia sp. NPDC020380]|uniref:FAD-dependent oxidoreductase n=1 Tax=Nocardia sp. NPDC020380 TaxID=3364309 RepID=UPI0037AA1B53